ncbi:MAG TPA: hypothetical protein EYG80_05780 [Flavobacteriaceae bacterium]|nr:hypothetical protein [Flavobacteriaceae bacterium]
MEYIQNLSDSEIKLVLMQISILLSMSTLLLIIRNRIVDNRKKLEININFPLYFKSDDTFLNDGIKMFSIDILNKGNTPIFIDNPLIKYPQKLNSKPYFFLLAKDGSDKFPIKLDVGEIHKKQDTLKYIVEILKKDFQSSSKIQIKAVDTLGNKYFSKKIRIRDLEDELLRGNDIDNL